MWKKLGLLFQAWSGMQAFNELDIEEKDVVFYSEDNASWVHFEPIIKELLEKHRQKICYLTSSIDDPILKGNEKLIRSFYIGNGMIRTLLFSWLRVRLMIMTMPDLENYYIKRSKVYPVHYIYVFHNMASTHMVFRTGAYDHYDTIFCVGPHHEKEIRTAEKLYGLPAKNLVEHGNSRLDSVLFEAAKREKKDSSNGQKRILIAPSYGKNALLETCGIRLIEILLNAGYFVTARPHPLTVRDNNSLISQITQKYGSNANFLLETDVASQASLHSSQLLISDYSGAAFEFALGLGKPVVFVDLPRNINNPKYTEHYCQTFVRFIRSQNGYVLSTDNLEKAPELIDDLISDRESFESKIETIRSENIYNVGLSGEMGAKAVIEQLEKIKEENVG